jgi:hypothetical protein
MDNIYIFQHQTKQDHIKAIVNMLESLGYEVADKKTDNKINRMKKGQLKEVYSLIRYQSNSGHVQNDLYLIYGLNISEL